MPKKNRQLPIAQRQELRRQLAWDTEEFDVEVLDGPHPESPTGRWRVVVALGKRKVVLFQPERGHIKLDARSTVTRGGRPSTKTSDINKAITRAQKFLLTVRLQRAAGDAATERLPYVRPEEVSVGFIHDLFRSNGLDTFEPKFRKNLSFVMDLVEAFASRGFDPGQIDDQWVKSFIAWRTAKPITLRRRFSNGRENTVTLQPVSPVTALANVKDYDQVLEYAHRLRRGARKERLISTNPLRNIKKWPKHEKALRECASDELYELLMVPTILLDASGTEVTLPAPVDVCDRSGLGILRTVVALKYHTGAPARGGSRIELRRCADQSEGRPWNAPEARGSAPLRLGRSFRAWSHSVPRRTGQERLRETVPHVFCSASPHRRAPGSPARVPTLHRAGCPSVPTHDHGTAERFGQFAVQGEVG